jgi:SAM-dependent methyltransferase
MHSSAGLRLIREFELQKVLKHFSPESTVLELGGADGYQALLIASHGHTVSTLDIAPAKVQVFPVGAYDGETLPPQLKHFDYIFSSNVIEHVESPRALFANCNRVLSPRGVHIHIVPSASWRLWTSVLHPLGAVLYAFRSRSRDEPAGSQASRRPLYLKIFRNLFPPAHGAFPSSFHELPAFRKRGWEAFFFDMGLSCTHYEPSRLFYSGYGIFGSKIPIQVRAQLSALFGSSCHIFILSPKLKATT